MIKGILNILSLLSIWLDTKFFSSSREDYTPARRMCLLPLSVGIAFGIIMFVSNLNGVPGKYFEELTWYVLGAVVSVNGLIHIKRLYLMPSVGYKIGYFIFTWVISTVVFIAIFILTVYTLLLLLCLLVILILLFAMGGTKKRKKHWWES